MMININNNIQNKTYDNGRYEGDILNNLIEGKGIFYYNNGDKYEGDWKNNIREGKGILFYNNGNRYEGEFKNDLREGNGIFYFIMVINLKENIKMVKKKEKEYIILIMVIDRKSL